MKKNLYFKTLISRQDVLLNYFLDAFKFFASYAVLLIEVFIRKDFGERYLRLSSVITVAIFMFCMPVYFIVTGGAMFMHKDGSEILKLLYSYSGWYVFSVFFIRKGLQHHRDMKRNPSVFDFQKFSLSTGTIHPWFFSVKLPRGIKQDVRMIECFVEPGVIFLASIILIIINQNIGWVLMIASISYSMNYFRMYREGDNYIMNIIDGKIVNEEMTKAFVDDLDESQTRGFRMRGQKPNDVEYRKQIVNEMFEDDEVLTVS